MGIESFGIRVFFLSALIAVANFALSIMGYSIREGGPKSFSQPIHELIIFQAILLLTPYLFIYSLIESRKIILPRSLPKLVSMGLLTCVLVLSFSVEGVSDYSDYKSFAENKSALPEYLVLIYILYLSTKKWHTGLGDNLVLCFLISFFIVSGYRLPAIYFFIIFLANFKIRTIIVLGALFASIIVYTQALRFDALSINSDLLILALTSNAFDTLYSGDLISSANSLCQYSLTIPLSFIAHIFPLPSNWAFPHYQSNILNCTPTPGGGILAGYISYLTNTDPDHLIYLSILFLPFIFYLRRFSWRINWLYVIVFSIFAFRGFNYGPVALFKPILLMIVLFCIVKAISNILREGYVKN